MSGYTWLALHAAAHGQDSQGKQDRADEPQNSGDMTALVGQLLRVLI
ncbi:MAG: hypothetical protein KY462_15770 [Actinobacteria bacterium]|nr:hypothetical protein [Actinomycetota bacterium]